MTLTRSEQCAVRAKIKFKESNVAELKALFEKFQMPVNFNTIGSKDVLNLEYKFKIEYFDQVENQLRFFVELMQKYPRMIRKIRLKELRHKAILIQQFINELYKA